MTALPVGTQVHLVAAEVTGAVAWADDCAGATGSVCDLTMTDDKVVIADFGVGPPTLSVDDPDVDEASGIVWFTVTLAPAHPTKTVVQTFATGDGTAVFFPAEERDYQGTAGTLRFAPRETTKQVAVAIAADDRPEPDETFVLQLLGPGGFPGEGETYAILGKPTGTATILDDD